MHKVSIEMNNVLRSFRTLLKAHANESNESTTEGEKVNERERERDREIVTQYSLLSIKFKSTNGSTFDKSLLYTHGVLQMS